jgi:cyclophilin family peptidyl-prolyl cis-trans isomerase
MRNQIVLALTLLLIPTALPLLAADRAPAPAKPGSRAEDFRALHAKMNALIADLAQLRIKYPTASEEKRAEIQQQYKELIAKGEKLEPQLIEAAEKAYEEAPNADQQITAFLIMRLNEEVQTDDFEPAARIGKLLMENKCDEKHVPNWAGIAAFAVSDFATADKYLSLANSQGYYQSPPKDDKLAGIGQLYLQLIPRYKQAWAKEKANRARDAKADLPRVLLKTNKGDIELELFEDQAPNTVANFISLVQSGYYKNVTFHRVLRGFMAQGGDPSGNGSGGPGYTIADECYQANHREHFRGTLSMAKTAARDSGGSQFFLTFVPTPHLDGKHTVFGRVIGGMDVLSKLQPRDPEDKDAPRADKILEAKVLHKRSHEYKVQKMPD